MKSVNQLAPLPVRRNDRKDAKVELWLVVFAAVLGIGCYFMF